MTLYKEVIVAYDVSANNKRTKLYQALLDIGFKAVQKSVLWGRINEAEYKAVIRLFNQLLNKGTDRAFILKVNFAKGIEENSFGFENSDIFEEKDYAIH